MPPKGNKMSNDFKVFFDYRVPQGKTRAAVRRASSGTNSIDLSNWLDEMKNKEDIYHYRLFYVLKPNSEDVVKFGIAGTRGFGGAWGRLHQYVNEYGHSTDLNTCTGVQMLYLAGNKFSESVPIERSDVYKKEYFCKQHFRSPEVNAHLIGRGFERINLDRIEELFDIIDDKSNKAFGDEEFERRTSERLKQQNLLPTDKVVKITGHKTAKAPSKAMTKYTVYWNRPFILTEEKLVRKARNPRKDSDIRDLERTLDKEAEIAGKPKPKRFETKVVSTKEVYETETFAHNIILYKGGAKALELYKTLHPTATFRD